MSYSRKRYGVAILVMTLATAVLWLGIPMARGQSPAGRTIVLDPGHGGDRGGARGPTGSWEKDICLAVATALSDQLESGNQVFLTRNDDYDVALRTRTATANHHQADLLISLHCGGGFQHTASGMAVYYWKPGSVQDVSADLGTDTDTDRWDRTQQAHLASSRRLAMALQRTLTRMAGDRKVKLQQAPLLVLEGAAMPAVLIEIGYITNPATEKDLVSPQWRRELAKAIRAGIVSYFEGGPVE